MTCGSLGSALRGEPFITAARPSKAGLLRWACRVPAPSTAEQSHVGRPWPLMNVIIFNYSVYIAFILLIHEGYDKYIVRMSSTLLSSSDALIWLILKHIGLVDPQIVCKVSERYVLLWDLGLPIPSQILTCGAPALWVSNRMSTAVAGRIDFSGVGAKNFGVQR